MATVLDYLFLTYELQFPLHRPAEGIRSEDVCALFHLWGCISRTALARTISSFLLTSCDEPTSAFSMKRVIMHGKMATTLLQQPDLDAPEHSRLINQLACPRAEDGAQKPSLRCGPTYGQQSTRLSSGARGLGMAMIGAPGSTIPMSLAAF